MSKTSSNAIHELIKSLSKSEKRYFKVVSSRHTIGGENNYIKLFDYIDQQENYDEDALFSHFKNENFLNKFSITKNRLYESIMKALSAYHSSSSIEAQIHRLIHSAEILFKKSLYQHAKRQLLSAEKLAKKNDRFGMLIEISNLQKKLIETEGYANITQEKLNKIKQQDALYYSKLQYYAELWNIKSKLFIELNKRGKVRSNEEVEAYKLLIDELQIASKTDARSFDSEYLYYHINSAYYFAVNNLEKSLHYLLKNSTLLKNNTNRIKQEPNLYFSCLSNAIYIQSKLGNYREALILLKDLKEFPATFSIKMNQDLEIKLFSSSLSIELTLLIHKGKFKEAIALEEELLIGYKSYKNNIAPLRRAYLNFKMAVAYFGLEDYTNALQWINKILNHQNVDDKEDLLSFTQILNVMVHLELKHETLLPYAIKSTQRFLKSRNRTYQFETLFLKYMNKISKSENPFEKEDILEEIKAKIKLLQEDKFESEAFDYFDFESWIESKLKKETMAEIRKQKYQLFLK
ncbi:MAG: hypothetical protein ACPGU5_02900 [Lishizhenia sp.]